MALNLSQFAGTDRQQDAVAHWEHVERGKNLFLPEKKISQSNGLPNQDFYFSLHQERWFLLPVVPAWRCLTSPTVQRSQSLPDH